MAARKKKTTKSTGRDSSFCWDDSVPASSAPARKEDQVEAPDGATLLHTEGLKKVYDGRAVVNGVDIEVKTGEIVGLLGPNGAGKTTTFYMIVGLVQPNGGKVMFDGKEVTQQPMFMRARLGMGYLPQEESIFRRLTVRENIMAVMETQPYSKKEREEQTQSLMEKFGIDHVAENLAITLSGGEKRRLGLMMALLRHPNFLILDEPTNDLDLETLQVLEEFLTGFGGCLIIVSHDRFFMDKLVEHFFVFEGDGVVRDFNGSYAEYRESLDKKLDAASKPKSVAPPMEPKKAASKDNRKVRDLEAKIETLESEKSLLETMIGSGDLSDSALIEATNRYGAVVNELDATMEAWIAAQ
jgi:lipopolysaccharide export system ATP-binding protein